MTRLAYVRLLMFGLLVVAARAAFAIPIGFVQWDVTSATTGQFDIINETGPNSSVFPDTTFPVTTSVSLSGLSLTVHFDDMTTQVFGPSYFTLAPDGLSFDGGSITFGPNPTDATLTGTFNPTAITLNDLTTATIASTFSATILPSTGTTLSDADHAIIDASPALAPVPEPGTLMLLGTGLVGLLRLRRR